MRVLVTGGSGKLGGWVARDLRDHGYEVISVDLRHPEAQEAGIEYRQIDMGNLGQVTGAAAGCSALVHLAAIPRPNEHADEEVFVNNVRATYNVLQSAMMLGISRAIIASSVSAYGMAFARPVMRPLFVPLDETHPFLGHDPYALSKETDERTAEMFVRRAGMTVLAYRFNWIGLPGESRQRSVSPEPLVARDAPNLWGYIDVRDAARACRFGLEVEIRGFHAFNITANDTYRPESTDELLNRYLPGIERRQPLPGHTAAWSNARARELLGFVPEYTWRDDRDQVAAD